jgi:hypothetical protein
LGIVAVAASFVIVSYLLAPVSYFAVRRLLPIDIANYLWQFAIPLFSSLIMVGVILALKYLVNVGGLNLYLQVGIYVSAGALTYILMIRWIARDLSNQILGLVSLVLPKLKLTNNI